MADEVLDSGLPAVPGRLVSERYAVAQREHPLVARAVRMLKQQHHVSEWQAFAALEVMAETTGVDLDEASARVWRSRRGAHDGLP